MVTIASWGWFLRLVWSFLNIFFEVHEIFFSDPDHPVVAAVSGGTPENPWLLHQEMELIRQELRQLEGAWRRFLAGGGGTPGTGHSLFLMEKPNKNIPIIERNCLNPTKRFGKKKTNSSDTGALRPDKGDETFGMGIREWFLAFFDETIKVLTHDGPKAEWFVWWFHIGESSQNDVDYY